MILVILLPWMREKRKDKSEKIMILPDNMNRSNVEEQFFHSFHCVFF